jgi:phenylalanyl-tRNA synthetase beta chain
MKISLNWIKEYTQIDLSVDELVEKIGAQLGAVEEVIDLGKKYQGIVVARVVTCVPHPNADKLKVCSIDDGGVTTDVQRNDQGFIEVVCGAPNVKEGMLVAWLPPSTTVPSTYDKEPFTLEPREIRGVVSNGMLASGKELAINDDHNGILELNAEREIVKKSPGVDVNDHVAAMSNMEYVAKVKPGDDFAKIYKLDDFIIDIENKMFTHRPDCFGILGVAREIAGITGRQFTSPKWYLAEPTTGVPGKDAEKLEVRNELPELVPRFLAQVVTDVEIRPSPLIVQSYLSRLGVRPINNIVDITNYQMILTGQPLHAYDYDKVKAKSDSKPTLVVRHPHQGEKITILGGKVIEPRPEAIMIATDKEAIGIGGVMGGADTEVDATTKNIVLECANFDMYSIRRTAMEHGLFTDAVTRFTKGQSPLQNDKVLTASVGDVICYAAGMPSDTLIDIKGNIQPQAPVQVSAEFINARLGLSLASEEIAQLLTNVEFNVETDGQALVISPPFWRTDIEIPEDVVEEVGRLYGYDHLPLQLPLRDLKPAPRNTVLELKNQVRNVLSSAGATELLAYSFVHGNLLDKVGQDKEMAFQIANALSPELQYYRLSLTPSLLEKVHTNIKAGHGKFAIFEIGKVHVKGEPDPEETEVPKEANALSLVFAADEKAASVLSGAPYYQARLYVDHLLQKFGVSGLSYELLDGADLYQNPWLEQMTAPYEPMRSAVLRDNQELIWGVVGEFRDSVVRSLKLPKFTAGFEIDPALMLQSSDQTSYVPLPRFPKVEQDISLRLPVEVTYGQLLSCIESAIQELQPNKTITNLRALDIYQREDDQNRKQVTMRLTIASYERTLTDQEVNTLLNDVARAAKQTFGAERL